MSNLIKRVKRNKVDVQYLFEVRTMKKELVMNTKVTCLSYKCHEEINSSKYLKTLKSNILYQH